jgi:hypothetical protein
MATLVIRHATSQSAKRIKSAVNVENDRTGSGIAVGRHGNVMLSRTAINASGVRVDTFHQGWRNAGFAGTPPAIVFHRMLLLYCA